MAHFGRSLRVSIQPLTLGLSSITQFLLHSWEYFTTLDYEWSIIRGRRPYRRTIWVCEYMRLTSVSSATPVPGLIIRLVFNRFTPLRDFPPFGP